MNTISQLSFPSTRYERGLTLIEILVALMISAFLIAGVIQLFIGSKQTYRAYDALSRIQENGRFVLEAMARDTRMAGYYPRVTTRTIAGVTVTETTGSAPSWSSGSAISGNVNGSDITIVWQNDTAGACPLPSSECSRRYFVGPRTAGSTAPTCPGAANSLFIQNDGNPPQELIEGVQLMRIFYGEDTAPVGTPARPSVARQYVPAGGVGNWNNVVSVQINLLLVSTENNLITAPQGQQQTVIFPDNVGNLALQTVSDRCLGQAFSTTVALRNLP